MKFLMSNIRELLLSENEWGDLKLIQKRSMDSGAKESVSRDYLPT